VTTARTLRALVPPALMTAVAAAYPATAPATPVLGIHDGAVNSCDNGESWYDSNGNLIFNDAGYPNYGSTAEDMGNSSWWTPLNVGTVRFSPPWDIALPRTSDSGLVTAHDPSSGSWSQYHSQALKNEQACFDWWLNAAERAGQTVNVAFKPDYDYRNTSTNGVLVPDISTYNTAVKDFVAEYVNCADGTGPGGGCVPLSYSNGTGPGPAEMAKVHIITAWGEPNFGNAGGNSGNYLGSIPKAGPGIFMPDGSNFGSASCNSLSDSDCGPVLAAHMWTTVVSDCPGCVLYSGPTAYATNSGVVAGDFSSTGGGENGTVPNGSGGWVTQPYRTTYAQNLYGERPLTWGMHPYSDVSNEQWCLKNTGADFSTQNVSNVVTQRFLNGLYDLGYHNHTYVWLDEVATYEHDIYAHTDQNAPVNVNGQSCGVNSGSSNPSYSASQQSRAFGWLDSTLGAVTGTTAPGSEPVINRIYYFRSFPGTDGPGWNITPTNPDQNQAALYNAITGRP
jgi:hypothetical protein